MAAPEKPRTTWYGYAGGAALTILIGFVLLMRVGQGLAHLSYDLPFLFLNHVPDDLVIVYVDRAVKANLFEQPDAPLPRRYYARLLERLKADGARLVLFDFIFQAPTDDDVQFAEAIRKANPVVLVTA